MGKRLPAARIYTLFLVLCSLFLTLARVSIGSAQITGPGWFMQKGAPVSHSQALTYYAQEQAFPESLGTLSYLGSGTALSAEITELARALRYDPKLIYDYVHNHIDYAPYFGSLKGATLAYLDGSGNDFDQASLMIALLLESRSHNPSITTVQYVYGTMNMSQDTLADWLGVDNSWSAIIGVLGSGGIPMVKDANGYVIINPDGTITFGRV